jgi:ABC-2 type transport system permease protein
VRTYSFALLFGLIALVQVVGYEHSFPTLKDRLSFAQSFGDNKAIRLFYGVPHDLLHAGGYSAWRTGGILSIFAAVWGLLAAVKAMRAEEDAGRQELVLVGALGRGAAFAASLAAIGAGAALLWLALLAGLLAGGLPAGPSAYLALAVVSPALVFAGLGALASQLADSRRLAIELGMAVLAAVLVARIVADTSSGLEWLRWATPLGWAEELRPFAGPQPAVLAAPLLSAAALLGIAAALSLRRDVGNGLLRGRERSAPRLGLLSSPTALALRGERGSLIGWFGGVAFYAVIVGLLADTFSTANLSRSLREELRRVGASIVTPSGALGFYFLFFVLIFSLFACAQIAAARHEESEQRLETLIALPVSRRGWLGGRLALAAAGAAGLALAASVFAWLGAVSQGTDVSLGDLLGAGANGLPATLLFLGLGALAFAALPRAGVGIAYGLVAVSFCWELFGALLGAPAWTLDLSPFHHVGLVPAQAFKAPEAAAMLAIGAVAAIVAVRLFEHRDVLGA